MSCTKCGSQLVWEGSISRGKQVCPKCKEPEMEDLVPAGIHGFVSRTLARYYDEVPGFHRAWCEGKLKAAKLNRARTDPDECTCGHTKNTKHSKEEIEQLEIKHYGIAKP